MDTRNGHESEAFEELEGAPEDLESETDQREERDKQEDPNQGNQTGTYDPWLLV
jgi:hypothetical protein